MANPDEPAGITGTVVFVTDPMTSSHRISCFVT